MCRLLKQRNLNKQANSTFTSDIYREASFKYIRLLAIKKQKGILKI